VKIAPATFPRRPSAEGRDAGGEKEVGEEEEEERVGYMFSTISAYTDKWHSRASTCVPSNVCVPWFASRARIRTRTHAR